MYREWGWDVRLADCPWQACTVAANESLDLIVCDCETQPGELFTGCALRELGTQMPPVLMLSEEPHYVPLTQRHSRLRTVDRAYTPESLARESSACLYVLRRPEE
jgi:hypothetical protein